MKITDGINSVTVTVLTKTQVLLSIKSNSEINRKTIVLDHNDVRKLRKKLKKVL